MNEPLYTHLIADLMTHVAELTATLTSEGYHALAAYLAAPLAAACILYLTLLGVAIGLGTIEVSVATFVRTAFKIGLMYTFALQWGYFSAYGVALLTTAAREVSAVILQASTFSHTTSHDNAAALQHALNHIVHLGVLSLRQATWRHLTPYLYAIFVWGFGGWVIVVCVMECLAANVMLALLLSLAPLFISFTLFEYTQPFFERWVGMMVGYAFVGIIVSAVTAFAMQLVSWSLGDPTQTVPNTVTWIPLAFTALFSGSAVLQAAHWAKTLGGTFSMSSGLHTVSTALHTTLRATAYPLPALFAIMASRHARAASATSPRPTPDPAKDRVPTPLKHAFTGETPQ